ncbi:hypothetical protein B0E53_02698 [Micromonospora sp. MH33]|nr:hypothetical protein B0E53_02698 [Micromonospora sp. MH33]
MATVCPGSATSERSSISGLSGSYRKETCSNSTRPVTRGGAGRSGTCSSASSTSKTRSAEATPDWSRFAIEAIWVSGWVNCREYWMNACTSPRLIVPEATRSPPTTAIAT